MAMINTEATEVNAILKKMHDDCVRVPQTGIIMCDTDLVYKMAALAETYYSDYLQAMEELRKNKGE